MLTRLHLNHSGVVSFLISYQTYLFLAGQLDSLNRSPALEAVYFAAVIRLLAFAAEDSVAEAVGFAVEDSQPGFEDDTQEAPNHR